MDYGMPTLVSLDTIEENLCLCQALGLQFVELNMNLPTCQVQALRDTDALNRLMERYGVYCTLHLDENLNPGDFNRLVAMAHLDTVTEAIRLSGALSIPTLTLHLNPGVYFTLPDERIYLFEKYSASYLAQMTLFRDECTRAVGSGHIRLCIENTDGFTPFQQKTVELLLDSPAFGLTFDIGHSHTAGDADAAFLLGHADRLLHFHIHDAKGTKNHLPLGTGSVDLPGRLALAERTGCRCVLEVKTEEALRRSAAWIRRHGPGTLDSPEER